MNTRVFRIIPFLTLLSLALSASQCDAGVYHFDEAADYSEEEIAIMLQLENGVFQTEKDEIKVNYCPGYEHPTNKEESFEFREDRLIVTSGSEKQYYDRDSSGRYCKKPSKNEEVCISQLKEDSYYIAAYYRPYEEASWELCFSANHTFSNIDKQASEDEIVNPGPAEGEEALPDQEDSQPESQSDPDAENPVDEPATTGEQGGTTSPFRDWYGPACPEMEGTFPYEWEVHLVENPETGEFIGSIKFHSCPGGGRVLYTVTGTKTDDNLVQLQGTKKTGGGALHEDSADNRTFVFDLSSGTIIE